MTDERVSPRLAPSCASVVARDARSWAGLVLCASSHGSTTCTAEVSIPVFFSLISLATKNDARCRKMDGYAIENLGLYIFLQIRIAGVKSKQVMFA